MFFFFTNANIEFYITTENILKAIDLRDTRKENKLVRNGLLLLH